jgi:hypothetical protein
MREWFHKKTLEKRWFSDEDIPGSDFTEKLIQYTGAVWNEEKEDWDYVLPEFSEEDLRAVSEQEIDDGLENFLDSLDFEE